jgi:glycosyltransferase involved in cell wall biosynthesis
MRLLAVNPTAHGSGAETVLMRALAAACAQGWEVTVACPYGPLADRVEAHGWDHRPLPELKLPGGPRPLAAFVLGARMVRGAARLAAVAAGFDAVVVNGLMALPAVRLARIRVPVVWLVHDVVVRPDLWKLVRFGTGALRGAIAVSEAAAGPLRPLGVDVRVVHPGTSWPVEPRTGEPGPPFVVGCAGALTPWKGHDVLLEAVAVAPRDDFVVEIAGGPFAKDTGYADRLAARAREADLAGRVRLLGFVPDVAERMRSWSVAVSASVSPESVSLVVLEAMSIGVPVVATDHGGPAELLGDAGVLVPPGDPKALAAGICGLLDDTTMWRRCHRAGPARVAAHFNLDTQNTVLLTTLAAMVGAA